MFYVCYIFSSCGTFFLYSVSTARSSFFDVSMGAVDSPDPLKETKEQVGEGSCPVLSGDTEAETVKLICYLYVEGDSRVWPLPPPSLAYWSSSSLWRNPASCFLFSPLLCPSYSILLGFPLHLSFPNNQLWLTCAALTTSVLCLGMWHLLREVWTVLGRDQWRVAL